MAGPKLKSIRRSALPPPAPLGPLAAGHVAVRALTAHEQIAQKLARARGLLAVALSLIVGIWLGGVIGLLWFWLTLALAAGAMMALMLWRGREAGVRAWGVVLVAPLGASWLLLQLDYTHVHDVAHFITEERQLAQVSGRVRDDVRQTAAVVGEFGQFSHRDSATLFTLDLERMVLDGEQRRVGGALLVRLSADETTIEPGRRITATGWLTPFSGPANPGEHDFGRMMSQWGVRGNLRLASEGNWHYEPETAAGRVGGYFSSSRRWLRDSLRDSLRLGLTDRPRELALLEALLLGRRGHALQDIRDSFQRVGLAHLLAISGAHLGILLGLTWALLRLFVHRPSRTAMLLLVVLGLYMLVLPLRVPIVRAAIMAGMFCAGYATGRGVTALGMLCLAAVMILLWRPMDLFSPGFQLSFGIVAALILFVQPLSHWLWPPPDAQGGPLHWPQQMARWAADYVAVSVVAFLVALPIVAYHFQLISPLAVMLSVLAFFPVVTMLGLGYVKMVVGLAWPSGSLALSWPLAVVTQWMLWLVDAVASWRVAGVQLSQPPSLIWVGASLAVAGAWLGGWYVRRRLALLTCVALLGGWAVAMERYPDVDSLGGVPGPAAMRINMLSVGHGSAYLVRLEGEGARPYTLVFDCGSQTYLDVGARTVVPAFRQLGVRHVDALFISHAHLDHYSAVIALVDAMPVYRVLVPAPLLEEAMNRPGGATAHLVSQLRERGMEPEAVGRGWRERHGGATLQLLWPCPDAQGLSLNDTSLVLSIATAGRRMLFGGDIEQEAILGLLSRGDDLRADIAELPHHGGFDGGSQAWLQAIQPRVVLQSAGSDRMGQRDRWGPLLDDRSVARLVTARDGSVEVVVRPTGEIQWATYAGVESGWASVAGEAVIVD